MELILVISVSLISVDWAFSLPTNQQQQPREEDYHPSSLSVHQRSSSTREQAALGARRRRKASDFRGVLQPGRRAGAVRTRHGQDWADTARERQGLGGHGEGAISLKRCCNQAWNTISLCSGKGVQGYGNPYPVASKSEKVGFVRSAEYIPPATNSTLPSRAQAKLKEAMLVEKLKKYEVAKAQGPMAKPDDLSGEERFYLKKVSQKKSNYVPVGRRGVFGGVILNMHLHWKKHETVKVICKPCKPGQIQEYASEIARLSGGIPVNIIADDTIVFYRGKNYVQPEVMSPVDTLSKKKALEKSKYEQSLETVRRFIAISEKELELYYRHVALYGIPQSQKADPVCGDDREASLLKMGGLDQGKDQLPHLATNHFSGLHISDISESDEGI